jgi:hypothetical protein
MQQRRTVGSRCSHQASRTLYYLLSNLHDDKQSKHRTLFVVMVLLLTCRLVAEEDSYTAYPTADYCVVLLGTANYYREPAHQHHKCCM